MSALQFCITLPDLVSTSTWLAKPKAQGGGRKWSAAGCSIQDSRSESRGRSASQEVNVAEARGQCHSRHMTPPPPRSTSSHRIRGADKSRGLAAASGHWPQVKESCCLSSCSFLLVRGGGSVGRYSSYTLPCPPPPPPLLLSVAISAETELQPWPSKPGSSAAW